MNNESQLVFIISQPRSGSTLTQKLLSNNSMVDTVSEPWILLPLLSMYKPDLLTARFNYKTAITAFFDYLDKTGRSRSFREDLKELILRQYGAETPGVYFIDKTPRYYEILDEISELFPEAKFLVLKRNPFASFYSMISTWCEGQIRYDLFRNFYRDFLRAPFLIHQFSEIMSRNHNFCEVKYEELVENPKVEVMRMYNWLGIPYNSTVLDILGNEKVKGLYGDDVYKKKFTATVTAESKDSWRQAVAKDSKLAALFEDYQSFLTPDFLRLYGYGPETFNSQRWRLGKSDFQRFILTVDLE